MNSAEHIQVTINGASVVAPKNSTILWAVNQSGLKSSPNVVSDDIPGIAVAANGEVVPRERWGLQQLVPNDSILIIRATQGG